MIANLAAGREVFTSNAFLVTGKRTVLIDPGNEFDAVAAVREHLGSLDDSSDTATAPDDDSSDTATVLDAVVLTHTHPDHVGNVPAIVEAFDVDVWGFDPDHDLVDHAIEDGETVTMGDGDYRALHTPGHKDDHLCFYDPLSGVLFAGDLVFAGGSFGRTDLAEGDRTTLVASIERLLEEIDESLAALHTGHGPSVTDDPYTHVEHALRAAQR
jgi:glyoxylase-like metal-dependent hydrolase (beta-lactamase superfamily II)